MCPSSCLSFCVSSSPPALQNGSGTSLPRPACRRAYGHGPCSMGQVSTCTRILLAKKKYIYICKRKITFQNLPNTCRGALWLPIWLPISYRRATAIWRPREQESAPCLFKFFILPFCSSNCMLFQLTIPQKIAVRRLWQISLGPCWALRTNFSSIFSMVRPWDTGVNKRRMKTV